MAAKKKKASAAPLAERPHAGPRTAPAQRAGSDLGVPALYLSFLLLLLLACNPALDSKFALPKLLVLGAGVLALAALLALRAWQGRAVAPARAPLLLAAALGAWWTATTPFALHLPTALYGEYDYYNGLFTHLCCLALFLLSMLLPASARCVATIVKGLVAVIVLVALVNVAETLGLTTLGLNEVSTLGDRVAAGALMNFAIPFVVVALLRARVGSARAALGLLLALLLVSEFMSQGRGPWVGLLVALSILLLGLVRKGMRWRAAALALAGLATLAGVAAALSPVVAQRFSTLARLTQDESLSHRFVYYRAALRALADHPIAGIGFENFRNSYPRYRGAEDSWFFDNIIPTMVHNGYLETALNSGVPALLLYLALLAAVLLALGRALAAAAPGECRDRLLCLLAVLCAYLVQDLSGWLDLALASVFWVTLGLAANESGRCAAAAADRPARQPAALALAGALIGLALFVLHDGRARLGAELRLVEAQSLDPATQWPQVQSLARQALERLPADARTETVAAQLAGGRFTATSDPQAYAWSHELFEAAWRHNPFDRMRLFNLIALESQALQRGLITTGSAFALEAVAKLAQTDADNAAYHAFVANFFALQGRFDRALAAVREARRLSPADAQLRSLEDGYRARAGGARSG